MKTLRAILLISAGTFLATSVAAELIYSNAFSGSEGSGPRAVADVDPGLGCQAAFVQLDGNGHLVSAAANYGSVFRVKLGAEPLTNAAVRLTAVLTPDSTGQWVGVGFKGENEKKLNEEPPNSGPWVLVGAGSVKLWGGSGTLGSSQEFSGTHSPGESLTLELTWRAGGTADLALNGDVLSDGLPVIHEFPAGTVSAPVIQYAEFQFAGVPSNSTAFLDCFTVETVADPLPEVRAVLKGVGRDEVTLGWSSAGSVSYAVDSRTDLLNGGWSNVVAGIAGTGGQLVVTAATARVRGFYRIRAEDPDVPVTETWDVTLPEETHSAYLRNASNCTADMAAVIKEAKGRLAGTRDTLVLQFPAGEYEFNDESTGIYVGNLKAGTLVFRGAEAGGTALRFNQIQYVGFWVYESDRVVVENLHLTRPGYYASEFDVVSVDEDGALLQIHEGFPTPDELKYNGKWNGQEITLLPFRYVDGRPEYDPCDKKTLLYQVNNDFDVFPFTDMGGGQWHAKFKWNGLPGWGAGSMVALKIRTGQNTLRFTDSDDCVARDLLITRFCGNPIRSFTDTNRLLVERVHIARPIGGIGGRIPFFAGSDGGIQLVSGPGGPTVRDCIIESVADDAIGYFSNDIYNLSEGALFEGNIIYDGQARGIDVFECRDVTIRSNTFYRGDWYSVAIFQNNKTNDPIQVSVTDCDIYGNVFVDCLVSPVIGLDQIQKTPYQGNMTPTFYHDDIRIHDNVFIGAPKNNHLVYVNVCDTINISSNTVMLFNPEEDYNPAGTGDALVYVEEGLNVSGFGNFCWEPTSREPWVKVFSSNAVDVGWIFNQAPYFTSELIVKPDAHVGEAYLKNIFINAMDPDPGAVLTYYKLSGPDWLIVLDEGYLRGTPTASDIGPGIFAVWVQDQYGVGGEAVLEIEVVFP